MSNGLDLTDPMTLINLMGVDYKREGRLYKVCCPFHHDTHPSLVVYEYDRDCYCYTCDTSCTWPYLYYTIKGGDQREAYDILGVNGDYTPKENKGLPKGTHYKTYEFVESIPKEFTQSIRERYAKCLDLDSEEAKPAVEFLKRKHLLDQAKEQGWKWDTGLFKQSQPYGALVIPYQENGEVVTCRLRVLDGEGNLSKPKTLAGTKSRQYALLRDNTDSLYICEGETDAVSLYASGCSVVSVPGVAQVRCINTAVLYAKTGFSKIVACGDNDGPGQEMNERVKDAARELVPDVVVEALDPESLGGLNDINDAYVAGKLKLEEEEPVETPIEDPLEGAELLTGKEAEEAIAVFFNPETGERWESSPKGYEEKADDDFVLIGDVKVGMKAWEEFREKCRHETPTTKIGLKLFWASYDFPPEIKTLRQEIPLGKPFTLDDVKRIGIEKDYTEDEIVDNFLTWVYILGIEDRHFQTLPEEKWLGKGKNTWIFI